MTTTYAKRVEAQIEQYASTVNMHDLPAIFHVWSHRCLGPGVAKVFGTNSIYEMFALAYLEARGNATDEGTVLSIGSGDAGVEIEVAKVLLSRGMTEFRFICTDLSPILLDLGREAVLRTGLQDRFEFIETDLNAVTVPGQFDVVMANHSLHHILELENLFGFVRDRLKGKGIFAINDMIGRNGHMRWPETAALIRLVWPLLNKKQRYHVQLKRYDDMFEDFDCSQDGFEGIRAQDILPLLLESFSPYKFFATGGIIDPLIDRGYGHGFDVESSKDLTLINMIAELNDILLDAGIVKPTLMLAYFTKDDRGEIFYRDRRAVSSVRTRDSDPLWTRFADKNMG